MERIASFCVDHTKLDRGMYLSRQDGDVLTWDIRMKKPNHGDYLSTGSAHTLEHLFATYARNSAVKDGVMQLASMRLCGNALTQLVIPAALVDSESTHEMLVPGGRLFEQRKATLEALDKIDGVDYVTNHAAFYLFPRLDKSKFDFEDAHDFAMKFLHEQHVLVIPGGGFDWHEDLRFRIVMLPEPETLTKAMSDMAYFLKQHRI